MVGFGVSPDIELGSMPNHHREARATRPQLPLACTTGATARADPRPSLGARHAFARRAWIRPWVRALRLRKRTPAVVDKSRNTKAEEA